MSRIRTVKPEWLEDVRLVKAGSDARVLSIALIILSDDYGRGRLSLSTPSQVFPLNPEAFQESLNRLYGWFVRTYEVRGQTYFEILNWNKHQKVINPGKPRVPPPSECENTEDSGDTVDSNEGLNRTAVESTEAVCSDLDHDLDHDHDQIPTPVIIGSPQARVARIIAGPATPQRAWQVLEAIAELHPGSNGRPVATPGVMHSANDLTKLGKLLEGIRGEAPLGYVAAEWLALLSLIDAGEIERPKGPMVPYFIACFGRLEERRLEEGAPLLAATEAAA